MDTLSTLLALCGAGDHIPVILDSLAKWPLMQTFDVHFVNTLSNLLNKQLSYLWFEILKLMWQHCNGKFNYSVVPL